MDSPTNNERIEILDDGKLRVAAKFVELLRANKLDTFERVMAFRGGEMKRSVPGRSTVRIELARPAGGTQVAFLKRYELEYLSAGKKFLRLLRCAHDEAEHEWNCIRMLKQDGFLTPEPVALGQEKSSGAVTRSFLLTAEIEGGVAGHNLLPSLDARTRRAFVLEVAGLTRRFFDAGYAHRDYYLSHIFVVEDETRHSRELFLIDLQRVFKPSIFRRRWRVKDLASLAYTAQLAGATRGDLMTFYKTCFRAGEILPSDKAFIREIMRRVEALHSRGPRYDVIWDNPGVRPPNV